MDNNLFNPEKSGLLGKLLRCALAWKKKETNQRYRDESSEDSQSWVINGVRPGAVYVFIGLIIVVWFFFSIWFWPNASEQALVERLGKYNRTVNSGLNFKLPWGIEKAYKIETKKLHRLEMGFRTKDKGQYENVPEESEFFTQDEQIADVNSAIQYYIDNAIDWEYNFADPEKALWFFSMSAMRYGASQTDFDSMTTTHRQKFENVAHLRLEHSTKKVKLGAALQSVNLQDANPPAEVMADFIGVTSFRELKQKLVAEGETYWNEKVPAARGIAEGRISQTEGMAQKAIMDAVGDSVRYFSVYEEYKKNPDLQHARIAWQTAAEIMQNKKILVDMTGAVSSSSLKLFNLNQFMEGK